MSRLPYLSDLSDDEWDLIEPLIPVYQGVGHPQEVNLQEIVNAIRYWVDNGIKWRAMPHDAYWSTVYDDYRRWVKIGLWEKINEHLVKVVRLAEGREEQPSLTSIDSQSVRPQRKKDLTKGWTVTSVSRGVSVISLLTS
ncbi:MAG: transposase [Leptolyngbyaceae cyanobacterium]